MPDLRILSWNVTRRCNLACTHCYLPAVSGKEPGDPASSAELTTSEALRLIDQVAAVNTEAMLILSGGEPLLRKDIFELAAHAAEKGMMVVLGSNGLLIDAEVARRLKECGVAGISISLDSVLPGDHDRIRSSPGAWERAVSAVRLCGDAGLSVQINTVVTRKNREELPALIEFSRSLGAKVYSPFFLVCTGKGEELTDLSPQQYETTLSRIIDLQRDGRGMMIRTRCAPTIRRILYERDPDSPLIKLDAGRCLAGSSYCRITPEGDVTPCPYMPLPAGNVRINDFGDIWNGSVLLTSLRTPSLQGKCSRCSYRMLCGGCRARAYAARRDHLAEDPWCLYDPKGGNVIQPPVFDAEGAASGTPKPEWTQEAEERLKRVPFFVRAMVRGAVERYALERGRSNITPALMEEVKQKTMGGGFSGH